VIIDSCASVMFHLCGVFASPLDFDTALNVILLELGEL
jgi:hypothetical protein